MKPTPDPKAAADQAQHRVLQTALTADLQRIGMQKKEFAAAVGVSVTAVNKWKEIPEGKLAQVASILGPNAASVRASQKGQDRTAAAGVNRS